jgi:hypothetical protein
MRYRTGPKTLPCGKPASVFLKVVISSLNFTLSPLNMILIFCNTMRKGFSEFEQETRMLVSYLGTPQSSTVFPTVLMVSVILRTCSMVECCCPHPN